MPRIFIRRGDVPATAVIVSPHGTQARDETARAAVICHPHGIMMILQVLDENDYRLVGYRGALLPKLFVDSILEEIAQHDIPDDHWIAIHRQDPLVHA